MAGYYLKPIAFLLAGFLVGELIHLSLLSISNKDAGGDGFGRTIDDESSINIVSPTSIPKDKTPTIYELGCPASQGGPDFSINIGDSIVNRLQDPQRCFCNIYGYYKRYKDNFNFGQGWYPFMTMLERATYDESMDLGAPPSSTPDKPVLYVSIGNAEGYVLRFFDSLRTDHYKRIIAFEPNPRNHGTIETVVKDILSKRAKRTDTAFPVFSSSVPKSIPLDAIILDSRAVSDQTAKNRVFSAILFSNPSPNGIGMLIPASEVPNDGYAHTIVDSVALDDYLKEAGLDNHTIPFMFIDTLNHSPQVMHGGRHALSHTRFLVFDCTQELHSKRHGFGGSLKEIVNFLNAAGFDVFKSSPQTFIPISQSFYHEALDDTKFMGSQYCLAAPHNDPFVARVYNQFVLFDECSLQ